MKIKTTLFTLIFFIVFTSCKKESNTSKSNITYIYKGNYKKILDTLVPKLLVKYKSPSVGIGIIENGKIEYIKVFGEHQKGHKAKSNTIYNVASITKPVVSAAVLKLVENGNWNLDEPLYHYFTDSDVQNDSLSKLLTTRHCLSHTTGFKNWRWDEQNGKLQFNFKPGTKFQYSGEGMEYLRKALEKKFQIGLDKLVDSLVFEPLKMKDATLGWLENKDTLRFAKWYNTQGALHQMDYKTKNINAADDMLITVNDMLLFGNAIMKQELIKAPLYQEMIKPQTSINKNTNQGLGWVICNKLENDEYILNHDGGDPGVVATLILLPKNKNGIAIFVNSDNGASITNLILSKIVKNGEKVIEGLHWENSIPEKIPIKQSLLKKYEGTYATNQGFSITLISDNQSLLTESGVFPRLSLYPKSETEFFPIPFEVYFKFKQSNQNLQFELLSADGKTELIGTKE